MYSKYIQYNLLNINSNHFVYYTTQGKRVHNLFIFLNLLKLIKHF